MRHLRLATIGIASALVLGGCSQSEPEATATPEAEAAPTAAAPEAAARSEADTARDASRKPAEVLGFLGIETGMHVIDLMAAGGWYSEVLSIAVGDDGSVDAQNSPLILSFRDGAYGVDLSERIGDRLTNVTRVDSSWAELGASGAQYDLALSALNFHDAYYLESPEAAAELMASVFTVLKPGGVFGIIDHEGAAGNDNKELHRIQLADAIRLAEASGFVLEAEAEILHNPDDDMSQHMRSEGLRGYTQRFVLKLRKPAE